MLHHRTDDLDQRAADIANREKPAAILNGWQSGSVYITKHSKNFRHNVMGAQIKNGSPKANRFFLLTFQLFSSLNLKLLGCF